jgi:hypothetical protein
MNLEPSLAPASQSPCHGPNPTAGVTVASLIMQFLVQNNASNARNGRTKPHNSS